MFNIPILGIFVGCCVLPARGATRRASMTTITTRGRPAIMLPPLLESTPL